MPENELSTNDLPKNVKRLRSEVLKESQGAFAKRFGVTPMAVSNWERGIAAPSPENLFEMGRLSHGDDAWYFWERAGFKRESLIKALTPELERRMSQPTLRVVVRLGAGKHNMKERIPENIAIPVLKAGISTKKLIKHGLNALEPGDIDGRLLQPAGPMLPNPEDTFCFRVADDAMKPVIDAGYVAAIDMRQRAFDELDGRIVAVSDPDGHITLRQLAKADDGAMLVASGAKLPPVFIGQQSKWAVLGRVIWWIGME